MIGKHRIKLYYLITFEIDILILGDRKKEYIATLIRIL